MNLQTHNKQQLSFMGSHLADFIAAEQVNFLQFPILSFGPQNDATQVVLRETTRQQLTMRERI